MKNDRAVRFVSRGFLGVAVKGEGKGEPLLAGRAARKAREKNLLKRVEASPDLERIVGHDPLPRSQVVSKVWDHIRKNNLQNPRNKREILADDKLKKVFGGKDRVSMFEMNKHLAKHLKEYAEPEPKDDRGSPQGALTSRR